MSRHTLIAVFAALLSATAVYAQEPIKPKELKDADRFIASSMTTNDTIEKRSRLERALNPIQQAIAKYPDNAAVWLQAGQVYSSLRDFNRADSAFKKAEELYQPYAADIAVERLRVWADLFNAGVVEIDRNDFVAATKYLELAEVMYDGRPESKLNLASIYSNNGDYAKAETFFRGTIAAAEGPDAAKLPAEERAQWNRYSETAKVALSNLLAQRGIDAYNAGKFDVAIGEFRNALTVNPASRDHLSNMIESINAQAQKLEGVADSLTGAKKVADAQKLVADISQLHADLEPAIKAVREKDPNNRDFFLLLLRSYQYRGKNAKDAASKAAFEKQMNAVAALYEQTTFDVNSVGLPRNFGDTFVQGKITNNKLTAGTPVKVHFTLLAIDGTPVVETDVDVVAPAPKQSVEFKVPVKAPRDVAGWKYEVK